MTPVGAFSEDEYGLPFTPAIVSRYFAAEGRPSNLGTIAFDVRKMGTFEPWVISAPNDTKWVRAIASGDLPESWCSMAKRTPANTLVRFGHEFNGDWYPWSGDARTYRTAFRRFAAVFPRDRIQLVWSPNVIFPGSPALPPFWPGDEFVDVIAIDGYSSTINDFPMPDELFGPTLDAVRRFNKPLMIGETAAAADHPRRAEFIAALGELPVESIIWFDANKPGEPDYRIGADKESVRAIRKLAKRGRVRAE